MDNASLSTLIEIAYAQQHAIFTFVATLAILVAEVAHSFPEEVSLPPSNPLHHECCNDSDQSLTLRTVKVALIWQSEWNMGKVLFLVTRLLPFWDGIVVYLYNQTSTPTSIRQCEKVFVVVAYLTLLGGIFAEVILYLRVFALSGSSRWVGWLLSILFLSLHGTAFAFVAKFLGSLKYVPSPVPTVIACLPVAGNHMHLSIVNILIASSELGLSSAFSERRLPSDQLPAAILALTLWFLRSKFRGTRSRLIVLFYRDGVLYFLAITGVTMGNVVCNVVASVRTKFYKSRTMSLPSFLPSSFSCLSLYLPLCFPLRSPPPFSILPPPSQVLTERRRVKLTQESRYASLTAVLGYLLFQTLQTAAGTRSVGVVVIVCFGLDVFRQMLQVSLTTAAFSISTSARARLNAILILGIFIGQVTGTALGTHLFLEYGFLAVLPSGFEFDSVLPSGPEFGSALPSGLQFAIETTLMNEFWAASPPSRQRTRGGEVYVVWLFVSFLPLPLAKVPYSLYVLLVKAMDMEVDPVIDARGVDVEARPTPNLVSLPEELLTAIAGELDWKSIIRLKQTCRILKSLSYRRELWLIAFRRYLATTFPQPFFLKKPLEQCSGTDIEESIVNWEAAWPTTNLVPTLVDLYSVDQADPWGDSTVYLPAVRLVPGGRFLIAGYSDGSIRYYDFEEKSEKGLVPKLLIPASKEGITRAEPRIALDFRSDVAQASEVGAYYLSAFNIAVAVEKKVNIWHIEVAEDPEVKDHDGQAKKFLRASTHLSSFVEPLESIHGFDILGTNVAYSTVTSRRGEDRSDGSVVIIDWKVANGKPQQEIQRHLLLHVVAKDLILLPNGNILVADYHADGARKPDTPVQLYNWGLDVRLSLPSATAEDVGTVEPRWKHTFKNLNVRAASPPAIISDEVRMLLPDDRGLHALFIPSSPFEEIRLTSIDATKGLFGRQKRVQLFGYHRSVEFRLDRPECRAAQYAWPDEEQSRPVRFVEVDHDPSESKTGIPRVIRPMFDQVSNTAVYMNFALTRIARSLLFLEDTHMPLNPEHSDAVRQRRRLLLSKAQDICTRKDIADAGIYLGRNLDMDVLRNVFDDLDAGPLRTLASLPVDAPVSLELCKREMAACDGLRDLTLIFGGLHEALMLSLAKAPPIQARWMGVMQCCIGTMELILIQPDTDRLKGEIAGMDSTIDFLFCLLRMINLRTGRPIFLESGPGSRPRDTPQAMRIVSQDFLELVPSACTLIARMGLKGNFAHRDILFTPTRVLLHIADERFTNSKPHLWPDALMIDAAMNSLVSFAVRPLLAPRAIEGLLEGGVIPIMMLALPMEGRAGPGVQGMNGPLLGLLPFLTDSRVFFAVKNGGSGTVELLSKLGTSQKPPDLERAHVAYSLALDCCKVAFEALKHPVQICHNLKHRLPMDDSARYGAFKACSGCHAVYYCSNACQMEDWTRFHSKECSLLSQRPRQGCISARIEREKLALLEVLANRFLPHRHDVLAEGRRRERTEAEVYGRVHVFDLAGKLFRTADTVKFAEYTHMTLPSLFERYNTVIKDHVKERIRQCALDVRSNPENAVLVAGMFLAQRAVVTICAKMGYNSERVVGERYRALTHTCSVQIRQLVRLD
ncbi:hypothetical protein NMY22_g15983 [Coprinellus aureogranulatus]|nr:hypothetical protein NMY22_g15983 [Coprinellus aureogranulatus]